MRIVRLVLTLGLTLAACEAAEAKRVALVIGNNEYASLEPLKRAVGDARVVKAALERLGFKVFMHEDLDRNGFDAALADFEETVEPGDETVIHYSGHGVAINGRNYLMPVTIDKASPRSLVKRLGVDAGRMVEDIRAKGPKFIFTILDACRDNPFEKSGTRSFGEDRGLARMEIEARAFILFSAGPGEKSLDGLGPQDTEKVSVFTRVLLRHIETPGLALQELARRTQGEVLKLAATFNNHRQFPDYFDGMLENIVLKIEEFRAGELVDSATPLEILNLGGINRNYTHHLDSVKFAAFSPDGRTLALTSGDSTVKLWDVSSGRLIRSFVGHESEVHVAAFSPDGRTLASASLDKTVKLWDLGSGRLIQSFGEYKSDIETIKFLPDGRLLVLEVENNKGGNSKIKLWDAKLKRLVWSIYVDLKDISSFIFSLNVQTLALGNDDGKVSLWDVASGRLIRLIDTGKSRIRCLALSPDGRNLASGDSINIKLWDVKSGRFIRSFVGHDTSAISFSPDGQLLASGDYFDGGSIGIKRSNKDNALRLWNVRSGRLIRSYDEYAALISFIVFSPDGRTLISDNDDKKIKFWDVNSGKNIKSIEGYSNFIYSVTSSPNGFILTSRDSSENLKLWNVNFGRLTRFLDNQIGHKSVAVSPDGLMLAFVDGNANDVKVKLWDVNLEKFVQYFSFYPDSVYLFTFSPDGRTLFLRRDGSDDESRSTTEIGILDVNSSESKVKYFGFYESVQCVAFSPNSLTIATGSYFGEIYFLDVNSTKIVRFIDEQEKHKGSVRSLAFSPDGRMLASVGDDKTIKLWDVGSGRIIRSIDEHTESVRSVAFSPDGRTLASGSDDKTIKLWDVSSGQMILSMNGHANSVSSITFSSDGRTLVSAGLGDGLRIWSAQTGRLRATINMLPDDEWAVISDEGYVISSPKVYRFMRLKRESGEEREIDEAYERRWRKESLSVFDESSAARP